ncbi:MAG: hypothetical protein CMK83_13645 [Pseudomonadales bacterium]|nr:hypothetical protein [Pseudomonadales bacterium]MBI27896.1 hypothetical protein [Pseudomonadales bacterium]|tara:strand:- start:11532 stop:12392 length:861 start_codon:yes stop_codon:yes gene_type:complete
MSQNQAVTHLDIVPYSNAQWRDLCKANLDKDGIAVCSGVIRSDDLNELRSHIDELTNWERVNKEAWFSHGNQRVFNLIAKDPIFLDLIEHPVANQMVEMVLGLDFLLSSITANVALPGNSAQQLHADQGYLPEPWMRAEVVNVIFLLDDFTNENGATQIIQNSHLEGIGSDISNCETTTVIAPAGSLVCMDGRLWHGTGNNRTKTCKRRALFAYFCRPYIRQQENFSRSLSNSIIGELSTRQKTLLGMDIWKGLGSVNGLPVSWMDGRVRIGPADPRPPKWRSYRK